MKFSIKYLDLMNVPGFSSTKKENQISYQVPWLYRALTIRANAVSSIPFEIVDRQGKTVNFPANIKKILYLSELSLCIFGLSYLFVERKKISGISGLRWLSPETITPKFDDVSGLVGFSRMLPGGKTVDLSLDDIVYLHIPDTTSEVLPTSSPVKSVLTTASIALNANDLLSGFFERGAIGATVLTVDGNPSEAEIKKLESWWRRVIAGVSNAWASVALRADVKPIQVGSSISDLEMSAMYADIRNQICASLGVPQTLLDDAANYATAKEHRRSFYDETVIPEAMLIESQLNEQLFQKIGMLFRFLPEKLEIYQQDEASKANSVVQLVSAGIMDIDTAREWLGINSPSSANTTAENMEEIKIARHAEFRRLREFMEKRKNINRPFVSSVLPDCVMNMVDSAMKGGLFPFRALKNIEDLMNEDEERIRKIVEDVFQKHRREIAEAVYKKGNVEKAIGDVMDILRAKFLVEISQITYDTIIANTLANRITFDSAVINEKALDWAKKYTYDLITGIEERTLNLVRQVISTFVETPGMTVEDVEMLLEPAFGVVRAKMIAVTEITRAYSSATNIQKKLLAEAGIEMERIWHTGHDELVCEICAPLNGQPESVWAKDFPDGAPAHVNCRCWLTLRKKK